MHMYVTAVLAPFLGAAHRPLVSKGMLASHGGTNRACVWPWGRRVLLLMLWCYSVDCDQGLFPSPRRFQNRFVVMCSLAVPCKHSQACWLAACVVPAYDQSKASCMPAHALQPGPGWHVVDCCAAPGNKTTHAAALLHANTLAAAAADCGDGALAQTATQEAAAGSSSRSNRKKRSRQESCAGNAQDMGSSGAGSIRVFAFDKDPKRLKRLATNVDRAGAGSIVLAQQADFLSIDPLDSQYAQVCGG